jgi:hypothetical protein
MAIGFRSYGKLVMDQRPAIFVRVQGVLGAAAVWPEGSNQSKPRGAIFHVQTETGLLRLDMSWAEVSSLASLLRCFQLDYDLPVPDDPRGPASDQPHGGGH